VLHFSHQGARMSDCIFEVFERTEPTEGGMYMVRLD
jgi:hypothetical protein